MGNGWCERHHTGFSLSTGCEDCNAMKRELRAKAKPGPSFKELMNEGLNRPLVSQNAGLSLPKPPDQPKIYTRGQLEVLVRSTLPSDRKEICKVMQGFGKTLAEMMKMRPEERLEYILEQQELHYKVQYKRA